MKSFQTLMTKTILLTVAFLMLSISFTTIRAAGEVDPTFSAAAQLTGNVSVRTVAVQPDGKILVGGQFTVVNKTTQAGIARFNVDGSIDTSFNSPDFSFSPSAPLNSLEFIIINNIAVQSDGKILVSGNFTRINGQDKPGFVRLNADGSVDSTFSTTSANGVSNIKIQSDNRIIIAGAGGLIRLNIDGSRDSSLQITNTATTAFAIQPDGKFVINNNSNNTVYRLNADGTTDNTFFPSAIAGVKKIVLQPDGKILLGGSFGRVNGNTSACITRLNTNGTFDTSFNPGGVGATADVNGIEVLPDGKILIAGFFSTYNGVARSGIARLNSDGTLDQSFTSTITTFVYALAVTSDGKAIIGGSDTSPNGKNLLRLNTDGAVDTTFAGAGVYNRGTVYKVVSQPDGKILVAGLFNKINGVARKVIARLNADGSLDTGFVPPSLSGTGLTLALQPDGKILVSKDADSSSPGDERSVVRLNSDGSVDSSFVSPIPPFSGGRITEIALQSDGKIIIAGGSLIRLNVNGTEDTTFTKSAISVANSGSGLVLGLVVQPNGKIVIGGRFDRVGTAVRNRIARVNTDGTIDETFNQPFGVSGGEVYDLVLQSNGSIVIGGNFTQVNAINYYHLARLFPDATLDTSFTPQPDGAVHSLGIQSDDKIIVGGLFNVIAGAARTNLTRLNANGTIDSSFGGTGANDIVFSATTSNDGKILVGGQFTRINGVSAPGIARLLSNAASRRTAFDFDGDGRADVSVFRPSTGYWYTSTNPATNYGGVLFGQSGDKLVPADYDGDGKTDVAVVRNGTWYIQRSQLGFTGIQFGDSNDVPVPADYDGDGRADVAVFRPSNGTWYLLQSSAGFTSIAFGLGTDKPVPGDYNGDGRAEVAVFRPSNGYWYLSPNPATNYGGVLFGQSEDRPVPADYDGDGRTDVAVFRPSNGTWYLLQSSAGFTGIAFGLGTDAPVPADYDGDRKADVAVFRGGNWYLNRTTQGFTGIQFGVSSDLPIPNSFVK